MHNSQQSWLSLELASESYIGLFDGDFHSVALQSTPRNAFSAYLFLLWLVYDWEWVIFNFIYDTYRQLEVEQKLS